jgi:hypothetical protein
MRIALGVAASAAVLMAAPAQANWTAVEWGMSVDEVVAAVGGDAQPVKDEKDIRIHKQRRLAAGAESDGGIDFEVHYYFDRKKKKLTMLRIEPTDKPANCGAMLDMYQERLGEREVEEKALTLEAGKPPIRMKSITWDSSERGGLVDFLDITIDGSDYHHCQILFKVRDFSED